MVKGNSWTDATDKQLLLAVIHLTAAPRPDWVQVAAMMGEGFTSESVRQHFQKLKKKVNEDASGSDAAPAATSTDAAAPKTPKKRTPGKKAAGEKSSTKRKAKEIVSEDAGDEDDEESPTKKVKEDPESFF